MKREATQRRDILLQREKADVWQQETQRGSSTGLHYSVSQQKLRDTLVRGANMIMVVSRGRSNK